MKKIFTLFSLLMLTVVAMAADLTTGVIFKGTWADTDGGYTPTEGEIKVTKTDDGLKFEVKNHVFNGYAFPDYTVDYKIDVNEDGSFNDESGFAHAVLGGNASTEGTAIMNAYWQMIKGSVNNKSIDLYIKYMGVNMTELQNVTFKGTAVETTDPDPEPDPKPSNETMLKENYQADGNGFTLSTPINWEKQKLVASIDVTSCTRDVEDLLSVGLDATSWSENFHIYYTVADKQLQAYYEGEGAERTNSGKFDTENEVNIEIDKETGVTVNGQNKVDANNMGLFFTRTEIVIGSGEGSNQQSNALYKYIKLVNKDVVDGINSVDAADNSTITEIYTLGGARVNSLQKGINIVRLANGKTVKVIK